MRRRPQLLLLNRNADRRYISSANKRSSCGRRPRGCGDPLTQVFPAWSAGSPAAAKEPASGLRQDDAPMSEAAAQRRVR